MELGACVSGEWDVGRKSKCVRETHLILMNDLP